MAPTPPSSPPAKKPRMQDPAETNGHAESASAANGDAAAAQASASSSSSASSASVAASPSLYPIPRKDKSFFKKVKAKEKARESALAKTGEEPIWFDIVEILGKSEVERIMQADGGKGEWVEKFPRDAIVEGRVRRLSAHGLGLVVAPANDWILAVPHALPGELVRVRVDRNERLYSHCDLVEVLEKSEERRDDLIGCKYFGDCPGCQYQMLPYEAQLKVKQDVVRNAFAHFSKLPSSSIPPTLPTLPSPLQYSYRTKLTPHFELPLSLANFRRQHEPAPRRWRGSVSKKGNNGTANNQIEGVDQDELEQLTKQWGLETDVGFNKLKGGGRGILDIEDCPIATPAIRQAMPVERAKVKANINSWRAGATLLLRDSFTNEAFGADQSLAEAVGAATAAHLQPSTRDGGPIPATVGSSEVITSYRSVVREKVESTLFETPSNSFFQNNRSVLPSLVAYVRDAILTARNDPSSSAEEGDQYLVDTYCGSGLFALLLSPLFKETAGVEISAESIEYAKRNAALNSLSSVKFLAGNAEAIFATIAYPPERTTVVIDPPRKGCDEEFIRQLVALGPKLVVYVSCNVHTQARDVGMMVGLNGEDRYEIVSVRGADLFPQTHHVEGVCVLRKKETSKTAVEEVADESAVEAQQAPEAVA